MTNARPRGTKVLTAVWVAAIALAGLSAGTFISGIRRDTRAGEPTIHTALAAASAWTTVPFRVWRPGRYTLFVSTVNHDPARVGRRFEGELEVVVRRPGGQVFYEQRFQGDAIAHAIPDNYGDAVLARMDLEPARIRRWTVAVRVTRPDPQFAGLSSAVKLWSERPDPGMGGLANYVMIVPAMVFAVVALLVALPLARRGSRGPLVVTGGGLLLFLVWSGI